MSWSRTLSYASLAGDALRFRLAGSDAARERAAAYLSCRLGRLKGLPQKLGQMLSFGLDEAPTNGENGEQDGARRAPWEPFETLQAEGQPLAWEQLEGTVAAAWGCSPSTILAWLDPRGLAASLGQVHHARLADGREVAVKVQYPGIRGAIHADLRMLGWLSLPVGNLRRGFDLAAYRRMLLEELEHELDYRLEARSQGQAAALVRDLPELVVPEVVESLSGETVLVGHWEPAGPGAQGLRSWNGPARRRAATALLRYFLRAVFQAGLVQADWHPGNLQFRGDRGTPQIVMYDFGSQLRLEVGTRQLLARLIDATIRGGESPYPLFLALGFRAEFLEPLADKLPALCRVLFEPFCETAPSDLAEWRVGERVADILGEDRWNFRLAGPPRLMLLVRAFHGLYYHLQRLACPLPWRQLFEEEAGECARQAAALTVVAGAGSPADFSALARHLLVRVSEDGRTRVQIRQPASHIERLDHLLDGELQRRIANHGVDLSKVISAARRGGYAPGPLFEHAEGSRRIEVRLE